MSIFRVPCIPDLPGYSCAISKEETASFVTEKFKIMVMVRGSGSLDFAEAVPLDGDEKELVNQKVSEKYHNWIFIQFFIHEKKFLLMKGKQIFLEENSQEGKMYIVSDILKEKNLKITPLKEELSDSQDLRKIIEDSPDMKCIHSGDFIYFLVDYILLE